MRYVIQSILTNENPLKATNELYELSFNILHKSHVDFTELYEMFVE